MVSSSYSIIPINSDNVFVAYNSNDFYYKTTDYKDTFCHSKKCSIDVIKNPNTVLITKSNEKQCYEKEICINKEQSSILQKKQLMHSTSDGRYNDAENLYTYSLLNTANLGIGLIGIIYSIFFINKNKNILK